MQDIGKILIFVGVIISLLGVVFLFSDKFPFNLGRLPGDISYKNENFSFYFPITTSILLSLFISFLIYVFRRFL